MKERYLAIDQVRGFAIIAMMLAHFGPALYERIGIEGALLTCLRIGGRFETPGFVAVFGLTLGVVYLPRAVHSGGKVRERLLKRSLFVLVCSLVISIPDTIAVLNADGVDGTIPTWHSLILAQYSVLSFYTVAILFTGLVVTRFARYPESLPIVGGSLAVLVGTLLGYDIWKQDPGTFKELFRLLLVSGKYAVFTLLGVAWILAAVGFRIQALGYRSAQSRRILLTAGISVIAVALANGRLAGWREAEQLAYAFGAPPQVWYIAIAAGAVCLMTLLLDMVRVPLVSPLLTSIGQVPLQIYVGHAFVLPLAAVMETETPGIPEALRLGIPMLIFIVYSMVWILRAPYTKQWLAQRNQKRAGV